MLSWDHDGPIIFQNGRDVGDLLLCLLDEFLCPFEHAIGLIELALHDLLIEGHDLVVSVCIVLLVLLTLIHRVETRG